MSLLAALLLLQAAPDEAGVRAAVEGYFAAVAKPDPAAAAAFWTPGAEQRETMGKLGAPSPAVSGLKVDEFSFDGDDASARISFTGRMLPGDGAYPDEPRTWWWADFRRENGRWRWTAQVPAAVVFIRRLDQADAAARADLVRRHPEMLCTRAVGAFCEAAVELATAGEPAEGLRAIALAVELAEASKRADLLAQAWFTRGVCTATQQRPGEAVPVLRKALGFAVEAKDPETRAMAGAWLGFALSDANLTEEGLGELRKALDLAERGDLKAERVTALKFLGMVHLRRGELREALRRQEEAVARAAGPELLEERIQALHELATVQWQLGDLGAALAATFEGLRQAVGPGQEPNRAKLLNSMGLIRLAAGEHAKALENLEEALALWTALKLPRVTGTLLNNLGETLRQLGRLPEAAGRLEAAFKILEETGDRPTLVTARNNLAIIRRTQGDLDAALAQYRLCVAEAAQVGNPALAAIARCNVADILTVRRAFAGAFAELGAAAKEAAASGSAQARFTVELSFARTAALRDGPADRPAAVAALRRAIDLLEQSRGGLRDPALKQSYLAQHAPLYYLLADVLAAMDRPAEAFAVSEEGKARTLLDLFGGGANRLVKSMSAEERAGEERRESDLRALELRLGAAVLSDEREELQGRIAKEREGLDEFRREVFARHPQLEALRGRFRPAPLGEIHRRLLSGPPRAAILSYVLGFDEVLLFVVSPGPEAARLQVRRLKISPEQLRAKVESFWAACSRAGGEYEAGARELYDLLVAPAGEALGDVAHLVISPDGVLHGLPFQALRDAGGRHLVERWTVSFAPSATALLRMEDAAARRRDEGAKGAAPFLALGAPEMPPGFADLEHAAAELGALAKRFGVEPLTGPAATETRAKAELGRARRIHVSTHGKVDEASPLYSFVVLGRDGANDGLLHAREIMDLDLRAELVVLSACETALGRQVAGEGVVGLTWALFAAGAPATVLSQWQVADDATRELMAAFYAAQEPGVPFAAALRRAQLSLLKDPRRAHPYFWAPFLLVGAGRG